MSESTSVHEAVLVGEVVAMLEATKGGDFLDCTLGGGGHSAAILAANSSNTVVALDRDKRAVERMANRFKSEPRISIFHSPFSELDQLELPREKFDGILADLGMSTDQLKEGRGFSFADSEALDMRMDESVGKTAQEMINTTSERDLLLILRNGGVGKEAFQIAKALVGARPFNSAAEVASAITKIFPQKGPVHPATVAMQAIRIAVNMEFQELDRLLEIAPSLSKSGGRLAIITFHSLEDKVVTRKMREWETGGQFSAQWPGTSRAPGLGKVVGKKGLKASDAELEQNKSSRSARLRGFRFE